MVLAICYQDKAPELISRGFPAGQRKYLRKCNEWTLRRILELVGGARSSEIKRQVQRLSPFASVAGMKHQDPNKDCISAYRSVIRGSQGRNLGLGTGAQAPVECCSILLACSACFLIQPRTAYLGTVLPPVGWAILYQLAIGKMPHRLAHG